MKQALLEYILISRSHLFDLSYYLRAYPDVRQADLDPIWHYIRVGWKECRNPSRDFDTEYYLRSNPDVRASGINPLTHYIRYGKREGRLAKPAVQQPVEAPKVEIESIAEAKTEEQAPAPFHKAQNSGPMSVSVIIPTRNGGKRFEQTLRALAEQDYPGEIEVVVIDSESTDGTIEFARKNGATVIPIRQADFDHGLTRNEAARHSKGEILVFLSQDSVPGDAHYIQNIVSAFSDPLVAGSYARQVPREDADIFTKRDLNLWLTGRTQPEVRRIVDFEAYGKLPPMEKYFFCNFDDVASAMRRSVWQAIPYARNDFGEDIEWSKDALEAGWKIAYVPDAFVIHSHTKTPAVEYSRNVLCHKKLYRQFGLCTVPTLGTALRSIVISTTTNWAYARENIHDRSQLQRVLLKVPGLSAASVWGQYQGVKWAKRQLRRSEKS